MLNIWDEDQENFILRDQELEIEVSNIYFITGLSQRGATPILIDTQPFMESMSIVMDRVYLGARKGTGSGKVDIQTIPDLALKVVLHTITRAMGSQAPHEETKTQFLLAVDYLEPTIYNWAEAVTINMKCQLKNSRREN